MDHRYLCYGDVIQLRGNETTDYLSALGFTHTDCFTQALSSCSLRLVSNPRWLLFQIVPRLAYENQQELHRQHISTSALLPHSSSSLLARTPEERAELERLASLSQSAQAEQLANSRLVEEMKGEKVRYGDEVQLKQVASGAFVQVASKAARDKSCSAAELVQSGRAEIYLRVESRHRYHSAGDPVLYEDLVLFRSPLTGLYLHSSEHPLPSLPATADIERFPPHPAEVTHIYEVNFSDLKTVWQAELCAKAGGSLNSLRSGEVVRLSHVDGALEADGRDVYVALRGKRTTAEGLFVLEGKEGQWRLRHLLSNRLLSLERDEMGISAEGSILRFYSPSERLLSELSSGLLIKVAGPDNLRFISTAGYLSDSPGVASAFFEPLPLDPVPRLLLNVSQAQDDTFLLVRADLEEVSEVEFLLSTRNSLYMYTTELQRAHESPGHSEVERVLSELVLFVLETESQDPWTCEGPPHPRRQELMRETGVIALVTGLLSAAFDSGLYVLERLKQSDSVIRVCGLAYRILRHASADSRSNERYCAQWLPLYLSHIQRSHEAASVGAEETLTEILSDNTRLLEEVVTTKTVELLVELLRVRREAKYARLLTVLCTSQGTPVPRNQQALCKELQPGLFFPLRLTSQAEVQVGGNWMPIEELKNWSDLYDGGRSYDFFLAQLELIGELAAENPHATSFCALFPFEICFYCAEDPHLEAEVRRRFVRMQLSLHVNQGLPALVLPRTVRVATDLDRFSQLSASSPAFLDSVKRLVFIYLREIQGALPSGENERNGLTKEVLHLALFLVNRGLCKDDELMGMVDSLTMLLDGTLEIVGGKRSKTWVDRDQHSNRFLAAPGTELPTQCRLLACQILSAVMQLRQDAKLTSFLRSFKGRNQPSAPSSRKKVADSTSSLSSQQAPGPNAWIERALLDPSLDVREGTGKDFLAVVLDLLQYEQPQLRSALFTMLIAYSTQGQQLLSTLLQAQLLEDDRSAQAFQTLNALFTVLQSYASKVTSNSREACECLSALACLGVAGQTELYRVVQSTENVLETDPAFENPLSAELQGLLASCKVQEIALELALKDSDLRVRRFALVLLARFCAGNSLHQGMLAPQTESIIEAIPSCPFALTLVREIYRENESLCRNLPLQVISSLCRVLSVLPLCPKKCACIRQLSCFLQVEGQRFNSNQSKVLGQLLGLEGHYLSQLLDQADSLARIEALVVRFEADCEGPRPAPLPLELQYLTEVLDVVALCGQSKLPALLSLSRLKVLLRTAGKCWPLRRTVLRCLVETQDQAEQWTWLPDLAIEERGGRVSSLDGVAELREWAQRYIYEAVVPCLERALGSLPSQRITQAQQLLRQVQSLHTSAPTRLRSYTANCLLRATEIPSLRTCVTSVPADLQAAQRPPTSAKESALHEVVKRLVNSQAVVSAVDKEFDQLVESYVKADQLTSAELGPAFAVPSRELFQSLISLLDVDDDVDVSDSVTEHGLRLLRRSVEMEGGAAGLAAEWEWEDWRLNAGAVNARQMQLLGLGAMRLVCVLFSTSEHTGVRTQAILLGIALLLGGNSEGQKALLVYMQQDIANQMVSVLRQDLVLLFQAVRREQQSGLDATVLSSEEYIVDAAHRQPFQRLVDLLRFLQLACEGHCRELQDHLREQWVNMALHGKSFNFVRVAAELLGQYVQFAGDDNVALGLQLLDTLIETVQGPCHGNQQVLAQPSVLETCRFLLLPLPIGLKSEAQSQLKAKTVTLLLSLLEGETDLVLCRQIAERLDVSMCKRRMLAVFGTFATSQGLQVKPVTKQLKKDSFQGCLAEGFELFALLSKLDDLDLLSGLQDFGSGEEKVAFQFFASHTARIEVVTEGLLQRTYFPLHPLCRYITERSKDEITLLVNRDSPGSKVTDLLNLAEALIAEMDHNYWLASKRFTINSDDLHFLRQIELALVFAINGLLLFHYRYTVEEDQQMDNWCKWTVRGFGIAVLVFATLVLVLWFILRAKLVVLQGWNKRSAPSRTGDIVVPASALSRGKAAQLLLTYGPNHPSFQQGFGHTSTALLYRALSLWFVFTNSSFLYFAIFLAVAALGQWHDFFYCLLLLDMVYMFEILHTIYSAIMLNANQLLWALALLAVWNYFYGLWGFYIDPAMYYDATIGTFGESLCQSLWECTLTTWNNVNST